MKMSSYFKNIIDLDEQEYENLSEKQKKEIIPVSSLPKKGKRKPQDNHGMTTEELLAEQQRLIANAAQYNFGDEQDFY